MLISWLKKMFIGYHLFLPNHTGCPKFIFNYKW